MITKEIKARAAAKEFAEKYGLDSEAEEELAQLLEATWDDGFDSVAIES